MQRLSALNRWYDRNRVLAWICVLIAVNQLGFGSIVPVVPLYAKSFGVSQALIGLTIAVYGLARFAASIPAGRLAEAAGRRWALAAGGFITVFGNIICGMAGDYPIFLTGRFVAGIGAAMVLTGGQIILTDITTRENRGRTMAIYMSVFLFAVGIGPLPGGYLAEHGGLAFPFFVYAAFGSVVTLLALFRVPETRGLARAQEGSDMVAPPTFSTQVRLLARQPAFLLVSMAAFASFFARTGALFNLVPQRAEEAMRLSTGQIGFGLAMISVVSLVVAYPAGVVVDRYGRKSVIVPSLLLSGTAMTFFAIASDFTWFVGSCLVWALASGVAGSAPAAYAADVSPPGMNAAAMSTFRMLSDSGYVVGPAMLGWLADLSGTVSAIYFAAGLLFVVGISFAIFAPESYRSQPTVVKARGAAD